MCAHHHIIETICSCSLCSWPKDLPPPAVIEVSYLLLPVDHMLMYALLACDQSIFREGSSLTQDVEQNTSSPISSAFAIQSRIRGKPSLHVNSFDLKAYSTYYHSVSHSFTLSSPSQPTLSLKVPSPLPLTSRSALHLTPPSIPSMILRSLSILRLGAEAAACTFKARALERLCLPWRGFSFGIDERLLKLFTIMLIRERSSFTLSKVCFYNSMTQLNTELYCSTSHCYHGRSVQRMVD